MSDLLSPLRRQERLLAVRLHELEKQLPSDGKDSPLWTEYLETVKTFTQVRAQLARPQPLADVERRGPRRAV